MALMELLLKEDVDNLGARGELVKVRAGYGRNYLLPRGLAIQATPANLKQIELQRKALLKREAVERETAQQQSDLLKDVTLEFARKVGEHGILYGSVTSMDIAEGLAAKGYEIDRRRIQLKVQDHDCRADEGAEEQEHWIAQLFSKATGHAVLQCPSSYRSAGSNVLTLSEIRTTEMARAARQSRSLHPLPP